MQFHTTIPRTQYTYPYCWIIFPRSWSLTRIDICRLRRRHVGSDSSYQWDYRFIFGAAMHGIRSFSMSPIHAPSPPLSLGSFLPVNKKWLVLLMRMGVLVVFVMLHPFSCGPIDGRKITLYLVPPRWQATFLSHNSDHDGCQSFQHHLCTVQRDTLACSRHIHIPYHSSPQIAILG